MIIRLFCCEYQLNVLDNEIATVEIANKDCFRRIVTELQGFGSQEIQEINISIDDSLIEQKDMTVVFDPFSIDVNDKTYLTKIYKAIECHLMKNDDNLILLNQLSAYISMNFNNLISGYPLDLTVNSQLTFKDFLKFLDVKIMEECQSLTDKLEQFITVNSVIKFSKDLIFVNLKSLLTKEELKRVISTATRTRCPLLLIENTLDNNIFLDERKLSIDEDLFAMIK